MLIERSPTAPRTFDDAWIEQWAPVYLDPFNHRRLRARRVSFDTFLLAPAEILEALHLKPTAGLLPAQRDVRLREDERTAVIGFMAEVVEKLELAGANCSNGRVIEKLRHRTWPRHADRRVAVDAQEVA